MTLQQIKCLRRKKIRADLDVWNPQNSQNSPASSRSISDITATVILKNVVISERPRTAVPPFTAAQAAASLSQSDHQIQ